MSRIWIYGVMEEQSSLLHGLAALQHSPDAVPPEDINFLEAGIAKPTSKIYDDRIVVVRSMMVDLFLHLCI
jgi:hypothetical protein